MNFNILFFYRAYGGVDHSAMFYDPNATSQQQTVTSEATQQQSEGKLLSVLH